MVRAACFDASLFSFILFQAKNKFVVCEFGAEGVFESISYGQVGVQTTSIAFSFDTYSMSKPCPIMVIFPKQCLHASMR